MSSQTGGPSPAGKAAPVVLVVEDDRMVRDVVRAMLRMGGFESVSAHGPLEALDLLRDAQHHFDVVLTDYKMPRMTGIELIQQTQALRPGLKTILYSGNADETVLKGYAAQPHRFLRKPFTPKVLNNLVREVLDS